MFYDLIYLLLLLSGIVILIENRLNRVIMIIGLQGLLLTVPVFQVHSLTEFHSWILVAMLLIFKVILTPSILLWTANRNKMMEHTAPRFGYLATLFFFVIGLIGFLNISRGLGELPAGIDRIGITYIFLLLYLGVLTFIVRKHWIALIVGFMMFENGIFLLTLILHHGLPVGIEFGAFVDAILVIVAAVALRFRADVIQKSKEATA
ncbi:MAG: formate hydrogenase [Leptospiraceae bacterium]|nr:formate hydrogenase [Leptospiraceae bacterium]MCP5493423.1 formate hydrogenase [Leptospiraceae bacterium]